MAKKIILFITTLLLSFNVFAQNKIDPTILTIDPKDIPAYESIPIIKDYRINQTFKGMMRWGIVGSIISTGGGLTLIYIEEGSGAYHESTGLAVLSLAGTSLGIFSGGIAGYCKGVKYNRLKKNNSAFYAKKDKIGNEINFSSTLEDTSKELLGYYINAQYPVLIFDELQLGVKGVNWYGVGGVYETKIDINGIDYISDSLIRPYYSSGIGYSIAHTKSMDIGGLFIHAGVGLKFNAFDLFYMKLETNYEISNIYYELNKLYNCSPRKNLTFGLSCGAYVF